MAEKLMQFSFGSQENIRENMEDMLLSINHRISLIEQSLHTKMDRNQCMMVCQNKVTHSQLNLIIGSINQSILAQKHERQNKQMEVKKQNQQNLNKLAQKLKNKYNDKKTQKQSIKYSKMIKPQQLYLQSNQTMFNLVIDQINLLKNSQQSLQKQTLKRNKNTVSLHNQICHKIQNLQLQIQKLQYAKSVNISWQEEDQKQKSTKQFICKKTTNKNISSDKTVNLLHSNTPSLQYQTPLQSTHQRQQQTPTLQHLFNWVESLQKQISKKLNIKDVLPIVRNNLEKYNNQINSIKKYVDESFETTKKILFQQSEINEQLSSISKIGYWISYGQSASCQCVKWSKQLANIVPQIFQFQNDSQEIFLQQHGNYLIKIHMHQNTKQPKYIIFNNQYIQLNKNQLLLKVTEKNSIIKLTKCYGEVIMIIHKL